MGRLSTFRHCERIINLADDNPDGLSDVFWREAARELAEALALTTGYRRADAVDVVASEKDIADPLNAERRQRWRDEVEGRLRL